MPPDIVDFLRPSPYDAVKYYLRKSGRDPISRTSNILNDPAVRLYTSTLVRVTLCFKYWDADWRQIVPAIHKPGTTQVGAYRGTLGALLARVDSLKVAADGENDNSTVGLLLKRLPYISGPFNDPSNVLSPGDAQALVEACSKDLENAQPKKGIKYFTDKKLGRTPPPGTKLKTVQPQPEKMTATSQPSTTPCHPSATTFQTPAASQRAGILTQPAASPWPPTLSTQATVPSISTPTLGPPLGPSISSTTMSLRSTSTTGASTSDQHILAKMKAQKQAVRNAHRRIFNTPLLGFGIRFQSIHQAASARPAALMHSRPEQEWRCPNCGFKNPEPIHPSEEPVKNDTSEIKEKVEETATCSNCKELRGKSDVPTTGTGDRACPECQEFLPEGIPERARVYSSELLKAHVIDWHSDYAIAVAWCTQQEVVSAGATIWACPSMRCPWTRFPNRTAFETHLLVSHIDGNEKRIPVKYLYAIACKTWGDARGNELRQLEALEKRKYQADDDALAQVHCELAELDKLVSADCADTSDSKGEDEAGNVQGAIDVDEAGGTGGESSDKAEPMTID